MGISDDQLKALGRLTAEFSLLEFMIASLVWWLSGDQASAMILTTHLPFKRLRQAAEALARAKMKTNTAALDEIKKIMKRASDHEKDRNRLIHSIWMRLPGVPGGPAPAPGGPLSRLKMTANRKFEVQLEAFPADDINRVADKIGQTTRDVVRFTRKHVLKGGTSKGGEA